MAPIDFALLMVSVVTAVGTLTLLRYRYEDIKTEIVRDLGWHRMWTERIMDTTDERDEPDKS